MDQLKATFNGADVRIISTDPVTVVVKDIADVIGYRAGDLKRAIKDKYTMLHLVQDASGRPSEMICATRPGISQALATLKPQDTARRKAVEGFQDWIYEDVLESIYDTGSYHEDQPAPETPDDPVLMLADATRQLRSKQIEIEERLDDMEERQQRSERQRLDAQQELRRLPEAEVEAPHKQPRAKLNEIVRAYAGATHTRPQDAWRELYRELYYRLNINVDVRAKNRGISKIEVLDRCNLLMSAYAIAQKIFAHALGDRL